MKITNIVSNRFVETWPSHHLVYEWEDDISASLGLQMVDSLHRKKTFTSRPYYKVLHKVLRSAICRNVLFGYSEMLLQKLDSLLAGSEEKSLVFELFSSQRFSYATSADSIPVIIDFWNKNNLRWFYKIYRNCPVVLITSLEVFNYLKANDCPLNLAFFPLSLSDRHCLDPEAEYPKVYDVLLAGRRNEVLWNYLQEFSTKYPEVEFLYQKPVDGSLCYESNKRGVIGKFQTRGAYIQLLRSSKIAFYSTLGVDEAKGGFNQVTPRFFELMSAKCLLLGRYADNAETRYFEMSRVCPNIRSYAHFEEVLLNYLNQPSVPLDAYREILQKHYTSRRVELLAAIMENVNSPAAK